MEGNLWQIWTESLEKTEVLWIGHQKKDLDVRLDGKKLNQRDSLYILVERFVGKLNQRDSLYILVERFVGMAALWAKVGWTCGKNGRGTEEVRNRKTKTGMGGQREEIFGASGE